MAIHAVRRRRRVVERPCPLPRHPAGLPGVVLVKAAEPAVLVHRDIQMHLVAGGAELRRIQAHERLQERPPVRLRRDPGEIGMNGPHHRILAGGQLVQGRVLHGEPAVAQRVGHPRNGVARHTSQTRVRLRGIDLLPHGTVEPAVEEHRVIVAPGAPFGWLRAYNVLHVLDRLPVELVVERAEMVDRAVPLVVDIFVTLGAGLRVHEESGRNGRAGIGHSRRRKKRARRPAALFVHAGGHQLGVHDPVGRIREEPVADPRRSRQHQRHPRASHKRPEPLRLGPPLPPDGRRRPDAGGDMHQHQPPPRRLSSHHRQRPTRKGGHRHR